MVFITHPLIFSRFYWLFYVTWCKSLDSYHAITPCASIFVLRLLPLKRNQASKNKLHYCSPFVGERSSVKCLGLTAGDSISLPAPSPSRSTFPTSPQFFGHPRRAHSLARLLARLFDKRNGTWKRLLRRLGRALISGVPATRSK